MRQLGDAVRVRADVDRSLQIIIGERLEVVQVFPVGGPTRCHAYYVRRPDGGRWFVTEDELEPDRTYTLDELLGAPA